MSKLMNELLTLLENLKPFPTQDRYNIRRQPDRRPEGFVLGKVLNWPHHRKVNGLDKFADSKRTGKKKFLEIHRVAKEIMTKRDPKFKFSSIQINKNNRTAKHVDGHNVGESYMIGLGNYTGGEVKIYDENGKSKTYETRNKWIKFNGSIHPHETKPFRGNRYTLVYYDIVQ